MNFPYFCISFLKEVFIDNQKIIQAFCFDLIKYLAIKLQTVSYWFVLQI